MSYANEWRDRTEEKEVEITRAGNRTPARKVQQSADEMWHKRGTKRGTKPRIA
jgi:hypothetical protein